MALTPFLAHDVWNAMLAHPLHDLDGLNRDSTARGMLLDMKETETGFEVKADVPGVKKEDIKVRLDGEVLNISVQQKQQQTKQEEVKGVKWHKFERSSRFVQRSVVVPDSADVTKIAARYTDGVLQLTMPKKPEEAQRRQDIKIE